MNFSMSFVKISILIAVLVVGVGASIFFIARYVSPPENFSALQRLPAPKAMPLMTLETQKGENFSIGQLKGYWSFVYFGFTHCPDMCPLELQQLNRLLKLSQQSAIKIQVIFISLDPERDSHEQITAYLANFNALMLGVRGSHAELSALSQFFAVAYAREPKTQVLNDYQIAHSGRIFLIDPDAHYVGSFVQPHDVDAIWADINILQ